MCTSSEWILANWKKIYSYHCEDCADGAEDSLGWCDAREVFREIQTLDEHVQRGENIFSTFRLLRLCIHGFEVSAGAKERCGLAVGKRPLDPD